MLIMPIDDEDDSDGDDDEDDDSDGDDDEDDDGDDDEDDDDEDDDDNDNVDDDDGDSGSWTGGDANTYLNKSITDCKSQIKIVIDNLPLQVNGWEETGSLSWSFMYITYDMKLLKQQASRYDRN